MRILIAEDDKVSQRLLQRTLERWGHEVVPADDGAQAWEIFHGQPDEFQFVISDWMMPEMDGLELVRRIRADHGELYVYLIMLTAKAESGDLIAGLEAGADDFMAKPLDPHELQVRLKAGERVIRLEKALAETNATMRHDLEAASTVQRSFLPQTPPDIEGFRFAWQYVPSAFVAGDILNIHQLDETHVAFYVLDVSGHGVPAAMLSVTLNRVLEPTPGRDCIVKRWTPEPPHYVLVPPREVVGQLNERFPMEKQSNLYHTVIYGLLDTERRTLTMTRAGHPDPIRTRLGQGELVPVKGGLPAGMAPDVKYPQVDLALESGDRIYFYSDGLTEAVDDSGAMFGSERLVQMLGERHGDSLPSAIQGTLDAIHEAVGASCFDDDLTLFGLEVV